MNAFGVGKDLTSTQDEDVCAGKQSAVAVKIHTSIWKSNKYMYMYLGTVRHGVKHFSACA